MRSHTPLALRFAGRAICLFLLASIVTPASASLLTFGFQGTVNSVHSELGSAFSIGDDWSSFYTFDSDASSYSSGPTIRVYEAAVVLGGFRVGSYFGGFFGGGDILVGNDTPYDLYSVRVGPGSGGPADESRGHIFGRSVNGYNLVGFEIQLLDMSSLAFDSTALPLVAPSFADFAGDGFVRLLFNKPGESFVPQVTVFNRAVSVPEPSTLALLSVSLLGISLMRRRRRVA